MSGKIRFLRRFEFDQHMSGREGAAIYRLDAASVVTKDMLMERLGESLGFPAWFGGNWDAFDELLAENLSGLNESDSVLIVVTSAAELWRRLPFEAGKLIEGCQFCFSASAAHCELIFAGFE